MIIVTLSGGVIQGVENIPKDVVVQVKDYDINEIEEWTETDENNLIYNSLIFKGEE